MRRIKEIREKEPERQIDYTDETWLNSGHRVKKEWIDLKALENPRRSIHDYGTFGYTKDPVGRGNRLIIVDCITEDGPVPGALRTFSTQTTSKKVKKYDFPPVESAVADEKAREMQKIKKQNDHMEENLQASTSTKNKRKEKSNHQLFVNKSKEDDDVEVGDEKHEEEAGILEDFDYHDNINGESYEKYFENVCELLKPNSVIIIDNASYHSRNTDDLPVSKWKKSQFQDWLKVHKIPFRSDALRTELWMLCKIHRATNTSKVVDNIAKRYGHEVLRLPPYHCDLNAIELIWADEKNFVARENKEMTLESVEKLFRKRRAGITAEMCKKCRTCGTR